MTTVALLLALLAAVMHATWNLFLKDSADRISTVALMGLIGAFLFLPWVIAFDGLPFGVREQLAASTAVHTIYYMALITAYHRVDFSVAYPVARGIAPALVAFGGWVFLGDLITGIEVLAIGFIVAALLNLAWSPGASRGLQWALLTGVMIAIYTVIDAGAVRESGQALGYTVTLTATTTVPLLAIALRQNGVRGLRAAAVSRPVALVVAAALNIGAYALVLFAATRAPVGLVAAVRESSVVFGAIGGVVLLSEPFGRRRIAGAVVVAVGIITLGLV